MAVQPAGSKAATGTRSELDREPPKSPSDLPKPSLKAALKRSGLQFKQHNGQDLGAALAFYAVLAVVPGLMIVIDGLGLFGSHVTGQVLSQVRTIAPGSAGSFVRSLISQARAHKTGAGATAIAGIVVALWSCSKYVSGFRRSSNVIYNMGEGRPTWETLALKVGMTAAAVVLLVVSAVLVVVSGPIATQVGTDIGAGHALVLAWEIAKWPVLVVLISGLLAVLFWACPNVKQGGIRWVSPGGLAATGLWIIVSVLFALYVTNFSSYDKTYGSLAGIVVFLVWLWLTNMAVLFGLELNAELDHAKAITEGLPEDAEPFAIARDTRKLNPRARAAAQHTEAVRRQGRRNPAS